MGRYTVIWPNELDIAYQERWLRSDSVFRQRLTKASHLIHHWLACNPETLGVPISAAPGLRACILPELNNSVSVVYHVNELDRLVTIVRITIRP